MGKTLNEKQRKACRELIKGCTQEEACVRAGYAKTQNTKAYASRLFARADAKAYLDELRKPVEEKAQIDAARVLDEYAKLAFLDPRRFFDEHGNLIEIHKLPADVAAALGAMDVTVEKVSEDENGKPQFAMVRKIKFADKKGALDSLARCMGMFKDKVEVTVNESLAERLQKAKERLRERD